MTATNWSRWQRLMRKKRRWAKRRMVKHQHRKRHRPNNRGGNTGLAASAASVFRSRCGFSKTHARPCGHAAKKEWMMLRLADDCDNDGFLLTRKHTPN